MAFSRSVCGGADRSLAMVEIMKRLVLLSVPVVFAAGWVPQSIATRASFRGLSAVDAKTVWVSGSRGTVLRTVDSGVTWSVDTIPGAAALDLRDIQAFDANTAIAMTAGE